MRFLIVFTICALVSAPLSVGAHSGGTNADGCHTNHKTGEYHCHNKKKRTAKTEVRHKARSTVRTYAERDYNCADFTTHLEAQDFYERNGGPLIDPHDLDRDHDGIACEALR